MDDDGFLGAVAPALCAGLRESRYSEQPLEFGVEEAPPSSPRDVTVERIEERPTQPWSLQSSLTDAFESTQRYLIDKIDEREDDLPRFPIVRYLIAANEAPPTAQRVESYEDALALSSFVSEFVAMLQAGFRLLKHVPKQPARLYTVVLSSDCAVLSWALLKPRPGERKVLTKRRVGDAGVLENPGVRPNCFALTFAPLAERQAGLDPREIHVFEPASNNTKNLLVDGFQLLVERAVHKFFASTEFRVNKIATRRAVPSTPKKDV